MNPGWILRLVFLSAAVTLLSSLSSGEEDVELVINRTTIVCSIAKGNGSHTANCTVPYKNTELVLSCDINQWNNQTSISEPHWNKGSCSSDHREYLGWGMNYTVNHGRRLTNSDSATYCCTWESLYSYIIDVNVHAPPHLNNVPACKGVEKSNCTVGEKHLPYSSDAPPLQIAVNFTGNGPFHVQWLHNKTEFDCQSYICSNESNVQKLILTRYTAEEAWMISGNYTAIVSNPYGSNYTTFYVKYDCIPTDPPHPQNIALDLREGMSLNYSYCRLIGPNSFDTVVCLTRNESDKLELLLSKSAGNCVRCTDDDCSITFNNSITKMQVSMFEESHDNCFPSQLVRFIKDRISLQDDGIIILSGYVTEMGIHQYCSIHLRVPRSGARPVWMPIVIATLILTSIAIFIILILWVIIAHHKRRCRRSRDSNREVNHCSDSLDEHRALLNMSEDENRQTYGDETMQVRSSYNTRSQYPDREQVEPRRQQSGDYATDSIVEDFPHELGPQEPVQYITIPA